MNNSTKTFTAAGIAAVALLFGMYRYYQEKEAAILEERKNLILEVVYGRMDRLEEKLDRIEKRQFEHIKNHEGGN